MSRLRFRQLARSKLPQQSTIKMNVQSVFVDTDSESSAEISFDKFEMNGLKDDRDDV